MTQKLLQPFKKLPQQLQNLPIFKKLQDLTTGRHFEEPNLYNVSSYGISSNPVCLAYDQDLCLIAVAYVDGNVSIFGAAGLCFPVDFIQKEIKTMQFLRNEGRLIVATSNELIILELSISTGKWQKQCLVELPFSKDENLTSFGIGCNVIYVGSSCGNLRQVGIHNGKMTVGDDDLTSLPNRLILAHVPEEKHDQLNLSSAIVSIELNCNGEHLLIGFEGGTVVIAQPQLLPIKENQIPHENVNEIEEEMTKPSAEEKSIQEESKACETKLEEANSEKEAEGKIEAEDITDTKEEKVDKKSNETAKEHLQAIRAGASKTFRTLSKTLKHTLLDKGQDKTVEAPYKINPPPLVTHILPHAQALRCATWKITSQNALEVLVSYDDGGHLTWKFSPMDHVDEAPIVLTNQDFASIPYGPLPCAAIEKIISRPSVNDSMITAFMGGLPRAEHSDKHTLTVIRGQDEHVCFQFGSSIRDFITLPRNVCEVQTPNSTELADDKEHLETSLSPTIEAAFLLVLTDRELVGIDLTQPNWPVVPSPYLTCLNWIPITTISHISIPEELMKRLHLSVTTDITANCGIWPIRGGKINSCNTGITDDRNLAQNKYNDLLAVGHIDGDVSLWALGRGDCITSLGRIHTLALHDLGDITCFSGDKSEDEAWPPFRKVGDCATAIICDSGICVSRLAVRTIQLQMTQDNHDLVICVGGEAGQVSIWSTVAKTADFEPDVARIQIDLLTDVDHENRYTWEGLDGLRPSEGIFELCASAQQLFTPQALLQINPPAPITAVCMQLTWQALAIGSNYGYAVIDLLTGTTAFKKFTYAAPVTNSHSIEGAVSKITASGRQLKATLRQSFRKIRKLRPPQPPVDAENQISVKPEVEDTIAHIDDDTIQSTNDVVSPNTEVLTTVKETIPETETAGESTNEPEVTLAEVAPAPTESLNSFHHGANSIRCFSFADTFVVSNIPPKNDHLAVISPRTTALLVGTAGGTMLCHQISWPENGPLSVVQIKELQLKHAAPIIGMYVLDAKTHAPLKPSEKNRLVAESVGKDIVEEIVEPTDCKVAATLIDENAKNDTEPAVTTTEDSVPLQNTCTTIVESHELLLCTEEQVKIFSLPSLRPKNKYRFWDKTSVSKAATVASESSNKKVDNLIEKEAAKDDQEDKPIAGDDQPETEKVQVAVSSNDVQHDAPLPSSISHNYTPRRVASFGIQIFPTSTDQSTSPTEIENWHVVLALKNGCVTVLSLPNLRRVLKAYCCEEFKCINEKQSTPPCVCNTANLVFWSLASGQISANEISFTRPSRLASVITTLPGISGHGYGISLPDWVRPTITVEPVEIVSTNETCPIDEQKNDEIDHNEHTDSLKVDQDKTVLTNEKKENFTLILDGTDVKGANGVQLGDITIDSIKEYLTDGDKVTVHTTESSVEKHTLIEGGNVTTTVHETECVNGEITKDDTINVTSESTKLSGDA